MPPEPIDATVRRQLVTYLATGRFGAPPHDDPGLTRDELPDLFPATPAQLGELQAAVDPRAVATFAGLTPDTIAERVGRCAATEPRRGLDGTMIAAAVQDYLHGDRRALLSTTDARTRIVVCRMDGGRSVTETTEGPDAAAHLFDGLVAKITSKTSVVVAPVNGVPGVVVHEDGLLDVVLVFCPRPDKPRVELVGVLSDKRRLANIAREAPFAVAPTAVMQAQDRQHSH